MNRLNKPQFQMCAEFSLLRQINKHKIGVLLAFKSVKHFLTEEEMFPKHIQLY